jgi:Dimerisation domain
MSNPAVSPEPMLQVAAGLWAAGVLKSGVELQIFDALAAGPQDVAALSQALGAAPLSLRVVLDAPVALGFVAREAQGYTLTEVSSAFLVSSQPTYLGALVADNANSAALFDVCKDYRRVVTKGYRLDPWAYSAGSNERVVHLPGTCSHSATRPLKPSRITWVGLQARPRPSTCLTWDVARRCTASSRSPGCPRRG